VATVVWWFPIAKTFPVGGPSDFSALSTEYLPMLLIVASALVPRVRWLRTSWAPSPASARLHRIAADCVLPRGISSELTEELIVCDLFLGVRQAKASQ
jgi:hypothetical protein